MSDRNGATETPEADGTKVSTESMTLMDYFAARAPESVPAWFYIERPPYPGLRKWPEPPSNEIRAAWDRMTLSGEIPACEVLEKEDELPDHVYTVGFMHEVRTSRVPNSDDLENYLRKLAHWEQARDDRNELVKRITREHEINRYFAWRWYYARMMVAKRGQPQAMDQDQ